uniref:Uncharacterized protein n=1 Tax=viral metagenome TaxID=1070528 RepID=A0A6M3KY40_9ZZZZ
MTIYEELKYLRDRGYFALVKNEDDEVKIFSTETSDGNVRSSDWCVSEKKALDSLGCTSYSKSEIDEYSKKNNWQIVRPIHVTEILPGRGFKEGEKVKILPNAKEEREKVGIYWTDEKEQMAKDGYGYFVSYFGSNFCIQNKDKTDYWSFPPTAIAPILERKTKEVTLEEALELLKKEYGEDVTITFKGERI